MKKRSTVTLLAVLLLITVIVASIVAGTYARYANTVTATAANWSFTAGLNTPQVTSLNLYDTITDVATTYPNLTEDTIAPGTSGSFTVNLDGTGSEVGIKYTIGITLPSGEGVPTGLTFLVDGQAVSATGYEGYISLADLTDEDTSKGKVTKTVTWAWAIGDDAAATTGVDNGFDEFTGTINVSIRGEQHIGTITTT
ncbi:MAG: hypothetical protein Q4G09_06850 [Clostridia bacterium]|nr:hypothetical protein [Clostridia bacterium]